MEHSCRLSRFWLTPFPDPFMTPTSMFPRKCLLSLEPELTFASLDEETPAVGGCGPHLCSQLLDRMRQENHEFKVDNLMRPYLRKKFAQHTHVLLWMFIHFPACLKRVWGQSTEGWEWKKKSLVKWKAKLSYLELLFLETIYLGSLLRKKIILQKWPLCVSACPVMFQEENSQGEWLCWIKTIFITHLTYHIP